MSERCEPTGGAQDLTDVSAFGDPRRKVIAGPIGPYPKDVTIADQTDEDKANDTLRFKVLLSDGSWFVGSPFPRSAVPDGVDPTTIVRKAALDKVIQSIQDVRDAIPSMPNLDPYALKTQIPNIANLATEDDVQSALAQSGFLTKQQVTALMAANGAGVPVGAHIFYSGEDTPQYWMAKDGSNFDRNAYPALTKQFPSGTLDDDSGLFYRVFDPTGKRDIDGASRALGSFQEGSDYFIGTQAIAIQGSIYTTTNQARSATADYQDLRAKNADAPQDPNRRSQGWWKMGDGATSASSVYGDMLGITRPKNRSIRALVYAGPPAS